MRAGAAEDRGAAEEDRGDGVEQEPVAGRRPEIVAVERGHQAGEDRHHPDQHEGAGLHRDHVDAHQPGAGRVVADEEDMGAEAGAVEQHPEHDGEEDHPERLDRECRRPARVSSECIAGNWSGGQRHAGAVHQHQLEPAEQERGADGDDQRGDVELGDQERR